MPSAYIKYLTEDKYSDAEDNRDVDVNLVNKYVTAIVERPELMAAIRNGLLRDAAMQQVLQQPQVVNAEPAVSIN